MNGAEFHQASPERFALSDRVAASPLAPALAALVAATIFAVDNVTGLSAAVAVLYVVALTVGGLGRGRAVIHRWFGVCLTLTLVSFFWTHARHPDLSSVLQLLFVLAGLGSTCALLVGHRALREVQAAYAKRDGELKLATATLEERVLERTKELARSESRFRTLFQDMNIAYAEQDIRAAKAILDEAKAAGAKDFRTLAAEHPEIIDRCIASITVTTVNDALLAMMGYDDHDDLVRKPPTENAENARKVMTQQLEAMFEGRRHFTTATVLVGKNGRRVPVAIGVNVPADWSASLSTHIDITEQQRAHEIILSARDDLARANRAVTVGALSTSLAHELNQPILAIGLDAETSKRWLSRSPPEIDEALLAIGRVAQSAARVKAIMRRTREKLVKGSRMLEEVDVAELASETATLLERDLRNRRATLQIEPSNERLVVSADRVEIQQVLINLIVNAADAMLATDGERLVRVTMARVSGNAVAVTVEDHGPGVPEDRLNVIFEPFFSTKPGGMGMGLQICQSIITDFGGKLTVINRATGGASFSFTVPEVRPEMVLGDGAPTAD